MIPWQFKYIRDKSQLLMYINRFNILPIYTFFSPNPGKVDSHLLYRDNLVNQDNTDWKEVVTIVKRPSHHFIWNPNKRVNKLVIDALSELRSINNECIKKEIKKEDFDIFLQVNRGYIALLNFVSNLEKISPHSVARQFFIVDVFIDKEGRHVMPLFCSGFHRL